MLHTKEYGDIKLGPIFLIRPYVEKKNKKPELEKKESQILIGSRTIYINVGFEFA